MRLGEHSSLNVEAISTGSMGLDAALGIGGVPRGRIIENLWPGIFRQNDRRAADYRIRSEKRRRSGVYRRGACARPDLRKSASESISTGLLVAQPDTGEQALEIAEELARSGAIDVLVIDSVAALVPRLEIRRRDGGPVRRPSGAAHVAGAPQNSRASHVKIGLHRYFYKPAERKNRRYLWESGSNDGRARPEILFERPHRDPAHRAY